MTIEPRAAVRASFARIAAGETANSEGVMAFAHYAQIFLRSHGLVDVAGRMAAKEMIPRRVGMVLKSAIPAGSLSDSAWAGALADYRLLSEGFIEGLRFDGVFDRILADGAMRRVPLRTRLAVTTATIIGSSAAGGIAKPVSRLTLANSVLEPTKAHALIIVADELLRHASEAALTLLGDELTSGTIAATDEVFLATLLTAAGSTIPSAGTDLASVKADLAALFAAITLHSRSRLYFVMPSDIAKALTFMATAGGEFAFPDMTPMGGILLGVPTLVSSEIGVGRVALLDASGIAADSDLVVLHESTAGAIQMLDDPTNSAATGAATPLVSLWQTNSRGLLAERSFGAEVFRTNAVAFLEDVDWGTATGSDA